MLALCPVLRIFSFNSFCATEQHFHVDEVLSVSKKKNISQSEKKCSYISINAHIFQKLYEYITELANGNILPPFSTNL